MLLWANLHLGFVFGLLVLGIWTGVRGYHWVRGDAPNVHTAVALSAACALATLANPSGYEVLFYPFTYLDDRSSLDAIVEWRTPFTFTFVLIPYYVTWILIPLALLRRRPPSLFVTCVALASLLLTFTAVRNIPFLALTIIPLLAYAFSGAAPRAPQVSLRLAGTVAVVFGVVLLVAVIRATGSRTIGDPSDHTYPGEGTAWIQENEPGDRLYNEYMWGGYVIYRAPDVPVFIDGRSDFYGAEILADYFTIGRVDDGWEAIVDEYDFEVMLIRKNSRLAEALRARDDWREAFTGDVEAVFVHQSTSTERNSRR
jgi:hypothetical protein